MKKTLLILGCVAIMGCATVKDPITGKELVGLKPDVAAKIDQTAEDVEPVVPLVTTLLQYFFPAQGAVITGAGGLLLGLLGAWKKWKGPLLEKTDKLEKASQTIAVASDVIDLMKENPELWSKAKAKLKTAENSGVTNANKWPS